MSADEQRKLAAIMFTDMVGYSALSQRDEKLAQALLQEHREILRPIFPRFNGTEIKTIGDGFLVEFGSALEAAQCAIEIQRTLAKRDADAPADRQIQVRIGIHIGDVVHRGGDVYGDGVNIASRIEPVAGPGGICVSMDVERQVRNALEARFEKLAPTELKNISVPMDLFRIVLPWERSPRLTEGLEKRDVRQRRSFPIGWVVAAVLLLVVVGAGIFVFQRQTTRVAPQPASAELRRGEQNADAAQTGAATASTIPKKSIAVLPFENLSRDPDNAFFADGVQDQILTNLSQIADLKVISRTSVMQYKSGVARNLREIGQQLGVAHVLEGSVQRAANKVRVTAQLIDASTNAHLWAQSYDRDLADVFAIQSEIAKAIADQLQAKLSPNEKAAIEQRPTNDLVAFDLYTRAKALRISTMTFNVLANENLLRAVELLNQAVARDPTFLSAWCELAATQDRLFFLGFDPTPARVALAEAAVEKARSLRPDAGETHLAVAQHRYRAYRDYDGARAEIAIAQRKLPNDPLPFELLGYIDRRQGRWTESTRNLERAIELDPRNFYTLQQISLSYRFLRRFADMAAVLDRAHAIVPHDVDTRVARALVDLDWRADTRPLRAIIDKVLAENPSIAATVADTWLDLALSDHDFETARRALAALGSNPVQSDAISLSPAFMRGLVARAQGDTIAANAAFSEARTKQEQLVREQPEYAPGLCVLGLIDAALGRKEDALRAGRRAIELLPVTKDSINGAHMIEFFAVTCAWAGEKDLALEQLRIATTGNASLVNYGRLKLHPYWDPLRGDPRFEKIVESLAPK